MISLDFHCSNTFSNEKTYKEENNTDIEIEEQFNTVAYLIDGAEDYIFGDKPLPLSLPNVSMNSSIIPLGSDLSDDDDLNENEEFIRYFDTQSTKTMRDSETQTIQTNEDEDEVEGTIETNEDGSEITITIDGQNISQILTPNNSSIEEEGEPEEEPEGESDEELDDEEYNPQRHVIPNYDDRMEDTYQDPYTDMCDDEFNYGKFQLVKNSLPEKEKEELNKQLIKFTEYENNYLLRNDTEITYGQHDEGLMNSRAFRNYTMACHIMTYTYNEHDKVHCEKNGFEYLFTLICIPEVEEYQKMKEYGCIVDQTRRIMIHKEIKPQKYSNANISKVLKKVESQCSEDDVFCTICQEDISRDSFIYKLKCGHMFCSLNNCLSEWFKNNDTCPVCRKQAFEIREKQECKCEGESEGESEGEIDYVDPVDSEEEEEEWFRREEENGGDLAYRRIETTSINSQTFSVFINLVNKRIWWGGYEYNLERFKEVATENLEFIRNDDGEFATTEELENLVKKIEALF